MPKRFDLKGYIVPNDDKWIYDLLEIGVVTYQDIQDFLKEANGEDIEVYIDSPGGVLGVASDIYNELRIYPGGSTSYIMNVSASASSLAMLGTQKVVAFPTTRVMIHNAKTRAEGDYRDMETAKQQLIKADESLLNAYQIKTGKSRDELRALLDKTTWMTAQEAKVLGFVDEIALKEGESLDDYQIVAALPIPGALNTQKMHEFAVKFKGKPPEEIAKMFKEPKDSGGDSRPVSDTQKQQFHKLRKKLYR